MDQNRSTMAAVLWNVLLVKWGHLTRAKYVPRGMQLSIQSFSLQPEIQLVALEMSIYTARAFYSCLASHFHPAYSVSMYIY